MGFSKKNTQSEITIAFDVRTIDENNGNEKFETVSHKFRRPSIKEREFYRQMAHSFVGGKSVLRLTKANLALWAECIVSVSGYDDLPEGNFKPYFLDEDLGKAHADAAVRILLDKITENEVDLERNLDS